MDALEFLVRAVGAGSALGIPSCFVSMRLHTGHELSRVLLWVVGAISGAVAALVVLVGVTDSTASLAVVTVMSSLIGAALFGSLPAAQKAILPTR